MIEYSDPVFRVLLSPIPWWIVTIVAFRLITRGM